MAKRGFNSLPLWVTAYLGAACAPAVMGEQFSLQIGNPIAAQGSHVKSAAFVFRTTGCPESVKSDVSGTAEGLVRGERQSIQLKIASLSPPGVYAVFRQWPGEGSWMINVTGRCAAATAGALVAVGPKGLDRETSRILPRPATKSEVEDFLKSRAAAQSDGSQSARE